MLVLLSIVHRPVGGDVAVMFVGMDQAAVQQMIQNQGFTISFVDSTTFNAFVATQQPPVLQPAEVLVLERATAVTELLNDTSGNAKFIRAVLLVILDEINVIRAQLSLTARTVAQLKTAIQSKINSGSAD